MRKRDFTFLISGNAAKINSIVQQQGINSQRPTSGYQKRPPKPPQFNTFSPKDNRAVKEYFIDGPLPMRNNSKIKTPLQLDNYQNSAANVNQQEPEEDLKDKLL